MTLKHRRGPWSSTEDDILLQLVSSQGAHNWVQISQMIQSRSPKQCRERYHQNLKPSLNLEPISPEEGLLIERLVAEMGKRWAEIARRLRGRSDNAVKNWWNGGMNRRKRMDNRRGERASNLPIQPSPHTTQRYNTQFTFHSLEPQHQSGTQRQYLAAAPRPLESVANVNRPPRRPIDAPLPSPSSYSSSSNTESIDGTAPPSLVSDTYSSNYSPHQPSSPKSIETSSLPTGPPNSLLYSDFRRPSLPVYHLDTGSSKQHAEQAAPTQLPLQPPPPPAFYQSSVRAESRPSRQWNDRAHHSPTHPLAPHRADHPPNSYNSPPPTGQKPLPSFFTITAPEVHVHAPAKSPSPVSPVSPGKDARMSVGNLLS